MDITLITLTIAAACTTCFAIGYALHVVEQLKRAERPVAVTRLIFKVGGQSDVCKQADWMPFGEVAR